MSSHRHAFTLIEILVASALFVSLMGVSAVAFQRISNGSEKALQVLELHSRADILLRYLESDLRNMPQTTAVHLQNTSEPYTLTFMKPVVDTNPAYFHLGNTENNNNYFEAESPRLTDLIWVRWHWEQGALKRGQSRKNESSVDAGSSSNATYVSATDDKIRDLNLESAVPRGIQNNAVSPMAQQHYDYFKGLGASTHSIDADGVSAAAPAQKLPVFQTLSSTLYSGNASTLFDTAAAPWRVDTDYNHLYTTLDLGNETQIADAYAVRNVDGLSVNKDYLNLLGNDATDADGNFIYPTQMRYLFSGIEYLELGLLGRDGQLLGGGDETDRLGDAQASLDFSGINPINGYGYNQRPTHVRVSYLLHSIDLTNRDDLDFDADADYDEALADAIRTIVDGESHPTRIDKIHAFQKYALRHGFASVLINQSVQLGY